MASTRLTEIGTEISPVTRQVTQEKINLFEDCGILHHANIHTNPEVAKRRLGTSYPIASGRMSITYASEALRKFFGPEAFNHTGVLNLKFLRPVKHGDAITVKGLVSNTQEQDGGTRVFVDLWCENQSGDKTAVGTASALVLRG